MDGRALLAGLVLLMTAGSTNTAAYHITGVPTMFGTSAVVWVNWPSTLGVICESDGFFDPENSAPESHVGVGGLCYADSGYATPNGYPPNPVDVPAPGAWGSVRPTVLPLFPPVSGGFWIQVGNAAHGCGGAFVVPFADEFLFDEELAFWATNGHVFFNVDTLDATDGSYAGQPGLADPGVGYCNAAKDVALA